MTDRESLVAAIASRPSDPTTRLVYADWLEENGEKARAELIRTNIQVAKAKPGEKRAKLLDKADDLLAEHENDWLGEWRERLLNWDFKNGLLHRVRLSVPTFLRHAEALFRREPVTTVELVTEKNEPLAEDDIRAAVAHPTFAFVRNCAIVTARFDKKSPVNIWFDARAANERVTRLRQIGPVDRFLYSYDRDARGDGITQASFKAFCRVKHLRTLRCLNLNVDHFEESARPWLVPYLAKSAFARRLRSLMLHGCGLTPDGLRQLSVEPAFASLRKLDVSTRSNDSCAWESVFESQTLRLINTLKIGADVLPAYARSPMALRIRDLTVNCAEDLDRDLAPDRSAWLELINYAPPPRRLKLECHNPGEEVFTAMVQNKWLRQVRDLSISGDSQYEVYSGETEGIQSLVNSGMLAGLTKLRLHEACDRATHAALARWPGMQQLESLELTDDYHGRLWPINDCPFAKPNRLRTLRGVVLVTEENLKAFHAQFRLDRLSSFQISFASEFSEPNTFTPRLTGEQMMSFLRSPDLARVTDMTLGFHYMADQAHSVVRALGDVSVLPRLKRLRVYSVYDNLQPFADGLHKRLGTRLQVN